MWELASGVRSQDSEPGIRHNESGIRRSVSGIRNSESGMGHRGTGRKVHASVEYEGSPWLSSRYVYALHIKNEGSSGYIYENKRNGKTAIDAGGSESRRLREFGWPPRARCSWLLSPNSCTSRNEGSSGYIDDNKRNGKTAIDAGGSESRRLREFGWPPRARCSWLLSPNSCTSRNEGSSGYIDDNKRNEKNEVHTGRAGSPRPGARSRETLVGSCGVFWLLAPVSSLLLIRVHSCIPFELS